MDCRWGSQFESPIFSLPKATQRSQNDQQVTNDAAEPQGPAFSEPLLYGSEVEKTHSWVLCLGPPH